MRKKKQKKIKGVPERRQNEKVEEKKCKKRNTIQQKANKKAKNAL